MSQVQLASRKLARTPSHATFFTQRTIPTTKRKWKVIYANSSHGGALSIVVSKMFARLVRQRWTTIWRITSLWRHKAGTADGVRETWSTRFLRWTKASTCTWRKQQDKIRALRGLQKFLGLLWWSTNWPWVDGYIRIPYHWKEYIFRFSQHPIYPWERTGSGWKGKRQGTADYLFQTT